MTSSLDNYYSTNYSKCNLSESFLASWKGVAYPTDIIQIFSLPLQILAFFIILAKSPVQMKSMKWPLFYNHLFCSIFDLILCTFSTIYLILPMLGVFTVGVFSWLGIPIIVELILITCSLLSLALSYIYLFENRSRSVSQNRFKMSKKSSRIKYYSLILLSYTTIFIFLTIIPTDQETAILQALQAYPCPTQEFFTFPILILNSDSTTSMFIIAIFMPIFICHSVGHSVFHVSCTIYYLYIAPSDLISLETQKKQKTFLRNVILQFSIPSIFILFSIGIIFTSRFYSQEMMNLGVDVAGLHGIGESIAVLFVHPPYRRATGQLIFRWKDPQSSIRVSAAQGNSSAFTI
ncbi:Serpentine Receptor, class H [Caenorhabditis elegans]|uniref:Serpentine Receptor, class H n=1 Tax=Caenorhabditis elegans TaxID=6239 RepID=O44715_CAEEL|nr:Serpentine Receptor, class H [Caenorhabditis elegans]CCD67475.1 Serpentine Receptor, class H [Caenorhabditis elegans]|eukprot:NP_494627.1 Serpentine Receptor, class H [Caenorhabditis elegans]